MTSKGKSSLASAAHLQQCIAYIKRTTGKQHVIKIILIFLKWDNYFESIGGLISSLALYVCCFFTRAEPKGTAETGATSGRLRDLQQFTAVEVKDANAQPEEDSQEMVPSLWEEPCALFLPISPSILWVSGNSHLHPVVGVWASEANTSSTTLVCWGSYTSSCEKNSLSSWVLRLCRNNS